MAHHLVLEHWTYDATRGSLARVLPDGCRDLIFYRPAHDHPQCFVSDLTDGVFETYQNAGDQLEGFRLYPHIRVDQSGLLKSLSGGETRAQIMDRIEDFSMSQARVKDALSGLEQSDLSIKRIAKLLGVQMRSLQRMLAKETGRSPIWWARLARVRKAANLESGMALADIAYLSGFSDQAHMSREFQHWFGTAPRAVFADPTWKNAHLVAGYGA